MFRFTYPPLFLLLGAQVVQAQATSTITEVHVWGRATEMLGRAESGSHGIVGNADFSTRPLMRVGELVEVVPGMIATQHSGPGKANQYFLRGMNLDHGSDFSASLDGMPINFRSHAHASGYLDINLMIPELVESVEFHKGPYYARNGDFSAAGSARFKTYDRLEQSYVEASVGSFNNRRIVAAGSFDTSAGSVLLAGELMGHDGPWELPADQRKTNVLAKYSGRLLGTNYARVTFSSYDSDWMSTDQIPLREVQNGNLGIFGYIDPTLGGESSRHSLVTTLTYDNVDVNAYYSRYKLNLFANPTYFLNDPINGDQIEQQDDRSVWGGYIHHSREHLWGQRLLIPRIGVELRFDDIDSVALFNTRARQRIGIVRDDIVQQFSASVFAETEVHWTDRLRTTFGLRHEYYDWDVKALQTANSGSDSDTLLLPKFTSAWVPTESYELYYSYGHGFHSNDVRGTVITVDPVTGDPADQVDALVRAKGSEIGLRFEPYQGLNVTLAHFWMTLDSELLFVGDAGTSEPNEATRRRGIEFTAFWKFSDNWVLDFNATKNHARFSTLPRGFNHVPDAHEVTANAGITYIHPKGFTGSFRVRHFSDSPLEESNSVRKPGTTLFNLGLSWDLGHSEIGLDVLNVFDSKGDDINYWFESQLAGESEAVEDFHFHPVESRAYRLMYRYKF